MVVNMIISIIKEGLYVDKINSKNLQPKWLLGTHFCSQICFFLSHWRIWRVTGESLVTGMGMRLNCTILQHSLKLLKV